MRHAIQDTLRSGLKIAMPEAVINQIRKVRRRELLVAYAKVGLVFLHVPRTAGTSISHTLYSMSINHFSIREMIPLMSLMLLALPRFAIVRNPWDRAVSAWSFARSGGGVDGIVRMRSPHRYQVPAFRTFEHFVHDWLEPAQPGKIDGMFRPQSEFLHDADGQLTLDHLGRFEDLNATECWLRKHNPAFPPIPHLNAAGRAPFREHYSPASRDAIARIYARDIATFGYDF